MHRRAARREAPPNALCLPGPGDFTPTVERGWHAATPQLCTICTSNVRCARRKIRQPLYYLVRYNSIIAPKTWF